MILLDTKVILEPLKLSADSGILSWIDAQSIDTLYLSAIGLAELRFGIAALPTGKRKETLHLGLKQGILPLLADQILPFDAAASQGCADLLASARAQGLAVSTADGYIAAIAKRHGFIVAARDASPFEAAGLTVINPWTSRR